MQTETIAIFIPIITVISIVVMIIYLRRFENEERMAMIDKGMNPSDIKRTRNTSFPLRASLLLVGIGIGLFLGYFLDENTHMEEVAYFSMLLICGGIGLGISYIIEEKKMKEELQ